MTTEMRAPQHDELSDELNAYLDGQLNAGRAAQVEQHVAACAVCARDLKELQATRVLVRDLPQLRAPRTFVVPAPEPAEPRWRSLLGWGWRLGSAASAACVLVAALSMNRPSPTSFSGMESSAAVAKNEAPAPQAAQERSALTARDSAAGGAAAPPAVPALAPAATQVAVAPTVGSTAAREHAAAPVSSAPVPARRSPATPWILAALLLGVVSAYVYTLERKAKTA